MELLLNLAWLLLALPAYWLWRSARERRRVTPLQCLLALGCVLVLLFPVISASDDLHAMRPEIEDSSISKRTVRQASSEKQSSWVNRLQGPAGMAATGPSPVAFEARCLQVSILRVPVPEHHAVLHAGRAPPISLLG